MFLGTFRLAGVLAAISLSSVLAVPALASGQQRGHEGSGRGSPSGHGAQARSQPRSRQMGQRSVSRTSTTRTRTANTRSGGAYGGYTRTSSSSSTTRNHYGNSRQSISSSRAQGFGGQRQSASSWQGSHPNWNGGYYYNNGNYYYDSGFAYPALMTNEWLSIAATSGGVGIAGGLSNDPTLYFDGSIGAFFSMDLYDSDRYGDATQRMRYAYFSRPYFWRNGTRFTRVSAMRNGQRGYQFRRQ